MEELNNLLIFETERLRVRRYTPEDADNFFLLNGNADVMRYIRAVKTKEECDNFLREVIADYEIRPAMGRWAAELKDSAQFIGSFAFIPTPHSETFQLGYALLPEYWGKGFASELTIAGLNYIFSNTALVEIFALTETANVGSQKVLVKCGFKEVDKIIEEGKELFRFSFIKGS